LRRLLSGIIAVLLLIGASTIAFEVHPAKAAIIIVPNDYPTIQEAVDHANAGDIVFVRAGTYNELVVISKRLTLFGENRSTTVINGEGHGAVVTVRANDTVVRGFTVTSASSFFAGAIALENANRTIVQDNNILSDSQASGVWVSGHNNAITQNHIEQCGSSGAGSGIELELSASTSVIGNEIVNNVQGIYIWDYSTNNYFRNNTMSGNNPDLLMQHGGSFDYFHQDIDASNTVGGKPVYYWINQINKTVPSDDGLLVLVNCANITAQGLALTNEDPDVHLVYTRNSTISGSNSKGTIVIESSDNNITSNNLNYIDFYSSSNNTVSRNNIILADLHDSSGNRITENRMTANYTYGLSLLNSSGNMISRNYISNKSFRAIHFQQSCTNNIVSENNITNNPVGIYMDNADNNTFYHNNFINNSVHVLFRLASYGHVFDDGYPSGGNYWGPATEWPDIYKGQYQNETGSDGIRDTPAYLDNPGGDHFTDHYPLMKPYSGPHDIGAIITASRTIVSAGYNTTVNFNVTILNYGLQTENFNFTFNTPTMTQEQQLTLAGRNSTTFAFALNTSGFVYGNCTAWAYVTPVEGETDTTDNNGTISIRIVVPGDVSGNEQAVPDGLVNMRDINYLIQLFNTRRDSLSWNPNADVNDDGVVNMRDINIAVQNFNKHE